MSVDLKKLKKKSKKDKKATKATRYGVTAEAFVRAWTTSSNIEEVMEKTKLPKNAVYSRVNSYRHKGVKLKKMQRQNKVVNADELNAIIQEVSPNKK